MSLGAPEDVLLELDKATEDGDGNTDVDSRSDVTQPLFSFDKALQQVGLGGENERVLPSRELGLAYNGLRCHRYPDGSVYEGKWRGGLRSGWGVFKRGDGSTYKGQWFSDMMEGKGRFEYGRTGNTYEGDFFENMRHGRGIFVWKKTNETYYGDWLHDQRHGNGSHYWDDGTSYEGEWVDGVPQGLGRWTWEDGSEYEGQFYNGLQHGYGKLKAPSGKVSRGKWVNGKLDEEIELTITLKEDEKLTKAEKASAQAERLRLTKAREKKRVRDEIARKQAEKREKETERIFRRRKAEERGEEYESSSDEEPVHQQDQEADAINIDEVLAEKELQAELQTREFVWASTGGDLRGNSAKIFSLTLRVYVTEVRKSVKCAEYKASLARKGNTIDPMERSLLTISEMKAIWDALTCWKVCCFHEPVNHKAMFCPYFFPCSFPCFCLTLGRVEAIIGDDVPFGPLKKFGFGICGYAYCCLMGPCTAIFPPCGVFVMTLQRTKIAEKYGIKETLSDTIQAFLCMWCMLYRHLAFLEVVENWTLITERARKKEEAVAQKARRAEEKRKQRELELAMAAPKAQGMLYVDDDDEITKEANLSDSESDAQSESEESDKPSKFMMNVRRHKKPSKKRKLRKQVERMRQSMQLEAVPE